MLPWLLAGGLILGAPALKEVQKPAKPPVGSWLIDLQSRNGLTGEVKFGYIQIKEKSIVFGGVGKERTEKAEFFINDGVLQVNIGEGGQMIKGIWRLEGDELTISMSEEGESRPDLFVAPAGSRHTIWVLKPRKPRN